MPAVGTPVTDTTQSFFNDASWMGDGQILYIENCGYMQWSFVPGSFSLLNLGTPGNVAPTTTVTTGSKASPGGVQGESTIHYFRATAFTGIVSNTAVASYTIPETGSYYFYGQIQIVNTDT